MTKLKFVYNVATLAISVWNAGRLVRAFNDQADAIAHKVTIEMAKQRLMLRRQGGNAVAGIASDVFRELGKRAPAVDDVPIYDVNESMLRDALGSVVERALA